MYGFQFKCWGCGQLVSIFSKKKCNKVAVVQYKSTKQHGRKGSGGKWEQEDKE